MDNSKLSKAKCFIKAFGLWNAIRIHWYRHISIKYAKSFENKTYALDRKHKIILDFVEERLSIARFIGEGHFAGDTTNELTSCFKNVDVLGAETIWILWRQGKEQMPPIVRKCYDSLLKHSDGWKVILITEKNINDYLVIPDRVMKDVGKTKSFTHFSDYIRLNLLSEYGGLWVDATFYVTDFLPSYKQYGEFYSIKTKAKDNLCVSQYRWFVSLMYVSPDSEWIRHIRNMFCFNWTHYLYPVDYLLIDYLFEYEQSHNSILSTLIANNPYNNEDVLSLQKNFNESFDSNEWNLWINTTNYFKLTYKGELIEQINGCPTFYGHILNMI